MIENIQRENLTPMEEARAYAINLNLSIPNLGYPKLKDGIGEKIEVFRKKIGSQEGIPLMKSHKLISILLIK